SDAQHLAHPGTAARALVADDDDVPGPDAPIADRGEGVLLAFEDAGGAAMERPLVPRHLQHAAVRREVPAQDHEPTGLAPRFAVGAHHVLAGRLRSATGMLLPGLSVGGARIAVEPIRLQETLDNQRHAACAVEIDRGVP